MMKRVGQLLKLSLLAALVVVLGALIWWKVANFPIQGELAYMGGNEMCLVRNWRYNKLCVSAQKGSSNSHQVTFVDLGNPVPVAVYLESEINLPLSEVWAHSWSPDGEQVALSDNTAGQMCIVTIDSMEEVCFPVSTCTTEPTWSPDGMELAYMASDYVTQHGCWWDTPAEFSGGKWRIDIINLEDGEIRTFTEHGAYPDWSPDGQSLLFASDEGHEGNYEIYRADLDGTNRQRLTDHPKTDVVPVWSPDGTQIAFISGRENRQLCTYENECWEKMSVYIMNADGSKVRLLAGMWSDGIDYLTWR
jgi:Tol biopolymer transport system component